MEERKAESIHYKNPPIVEAIIQIDTSELPFNSLERFQNSSDLLATMGYAYEAPISHHSFSVSVANGQSSTEKHDEIVGHRFLDRRKRFGVQFTRQGFVFNQAGPYENWEVFTEEAKRLWAVFHQCSEPVTPRSYHVRFINKLFVPLGRQLEDFLRINPHIPADLPQVMNEHYMRTTLVIPERDGNDGAPTDAPSTREAGLCNSPLR